MLGYESKTYKGIEHTPDDWGLKPVQVKYMDTN